MSVSTKPETQNNKQSNNKQLKTIHHEKSINHSRRMPLLHVSS